MHIVSLHPRVVSLASRLVEPNHDGIKGGKDDDDAIFAELEAEIEQDCDGLRNFLFAAQVSRTLSIRDAIS